MQYTSIIGDQYPVPVAQRHAVYKRWKQVRAEATRCPIRAGDELAVVDSFRPLFEPDSEREQLRLPASGPAPSVPAPHPHPASVVIEHSLQAGYGKSSQVYKARVVLSTGEDIVAVVKIVHEATFKTAKQFKGDGALGWNEGLFWTAGELVTRETWGYELARPLWGREVPRFYGSFIFTHPCGHLVPGVILEYVDGRPFKKAMEAASGLQGRKPPNCKTRVVAQKRGLQLMCNASKALYELDMLGLRHGDVAGRHILVCDRGTSPWSAARVAIIDLGRSFFALGDLQTLGRDCYGLMNAAAGTNFHHGCWRAFLRETVPKPGEERWLDWFRDWDDVDPKVSDLDEKTTSLEWSIKRHGAGASIEDAYDDDVLPRWAEDRKWSDISVPPAVDAVPDDYGSDSDSSDDST